MRNSTNAYLKVKVKKVSRLDLGGGVQASLGRDEEGGGGAVPEGVCLSGHLCLCYCISQLLQVAVSLQQQCRLRPIHTSAQAALWHEAESGVCLSRCQCLSHYVHQLLQEDVTMQCNKCTGVRHQLEMTFEAYDVCV